MVFVQAELERLRLICERIIKREKVKVSDISGGTRGFDVSMLCSVIGSLCYQFSVLFCYPMAAASMLTRRFFLLPSQ